MAFSKVLKFGGIVIKVVTDFQDPVNTEEESLDTMKNAAVDVEDAVDEGKLMFRSLKRRFTRKKSNDLTRFSPIPQPETENKAEIYEWMYKESTNIIYQLRESIKETCELNTQYRSISFRIYDDMLVFKVPNDLGNDWEYFKDFVVLESFALQTRLEKLNKYHFDDNDVKRIAEAKEKVKSLSHPPSNLSLANRFYKTDQLLAAYFSREAVVKLLFKFTTEEEYEKTRIGHIQNKIDLNKA